MHASASLSARLLAGLELALDVLALLLLRLGRARLGVNLLERDGGGSSAEWRAKAPLSSFLHPPPGAHRPHDLVGVLPRALENDAVVLLVPLPPPAGREEEERLRRNEVTESSLRRIKKMNAMEKRKKKASFAPGGTAWRRPGGSRPSRETACGPAAQGKGAAERTVKAPPHRRQQLVAERGGLPDLRSPSARHFVGGCVVRHVEEARRAGDGLGRPREVPVVQAQRPAQEGGGGMTRNQRRQKRHEKRRGGACGNGRRRRKVAPPAPAQCRPGSSSCSHRNLLCPPRVRTRRTAVLPCTSFVFPGTRPSSYLRRRHGR